MSAGSMPAAAPGDYELNEKGGTVAQRMAMRVAMLDFGSLTPVVLERAKTAILDTIGVHLAAIPTDVGEQLIGYARASGSGSGPVLGTDLSVSYAEAALINGSLAHVLDFDDRGHASTHTLAAIWALAGSGTISGQDLLVSYVAGREIRMCLSEFFDAGRFDGNGRGPGSTGWHGTGVYGAVGSAAAAGKVLDLARSEIVNALAISASLASGLVANFGTTAKPIHAGNAARSGVTAALLAQRGANADARVFESSKGFTEAITGGVGDWPLENLLERLETSFHIERHGVRIKPYPSCSGSHPYIEAARTLRRDPAYATANIEEITMPPRASLTRPFPANWIETKFSATFCVVSTLLTGGVSMATCTDEYLADAEVQELLKRVVYVPETERQVTIRLKSGQVLSEGLGRSRDLETTSDVVSKYRSLVEPLKGRQRADDIAEMVWRLEDVKDVRELLSKCK